ncbi:MAG: DUF6491 family protein [Dokdonella sp.]
MHRRIAATLFTLIAGSAVYADTPETQQKNLDRYTPYLQEPVDQFQYWSLYKWQLVGAEKIVVWTTVKDAFLLTVEQPCSQLQWANGITLTTQESRFVSRRIDYVNAGGDRCRIVEIQPLDYARLLKDDDAPKK